MSDEESEILLLLVKRCIGLENRVSAVTALLKLKGVVTDGEIEDAVRASARSAVKQQRASTALESLLARSAHSE